jgi:hypothetical protein
VTSRGAGAADAPATGTIELPTRTVSPQTAVSTRMLLAIGLLALCTLIVYRGRDAYHDAAHPGQPRSGSGRTSPCSGRAAPTRW